MVPYDKRNAMKQSAPENYDVKKTIPRNKTMLPFFFKVIQDGTSKQMSTTYLNMKVNQTGPSKQETWSKMNKQAC